MALRKVCGIDDLAEGQGMTFAVSGVDIAVFHAKDGFFAIDNACAHAAGPLGEGFLEQDVVECPLHGWKYSIRTGQCTNVPGAKVKAFRVEVKGKEVLVDID